MNKSILLVLILFMAFGCTSPENEIQVNLQSIIADQWKPEGNLQFNENEVDHMLESLSKNVEFDTLLTNFLKSFQDVSDKMHENRVNYKEKYDKRPTPEYISEGIKSDPIFDLHHKNSTAFTKYIYSMVKNMEPNTKHTFLMKFRERFISSKLDLYHDKNIPLDSE